MGVVMIVFGVYIRNFQNKARLIFKIVQCSSKIIGA